MKFQILVVVQSLQLKINIMLITKEEQEALLQKYINEKHNDDEANGFIDGMKAMLQLIYNKSFTSNQKKVS